MTGHFTALVWKGVTKIGCAKNSAGPSVMWVCRYLSGNKLGAWTANMQGGRNISVQPLAIGKTLEICTNEAPNTLDYVSPIVTQLGDPSEWPDYEFAQPSSVFHIFLGGEVGTRQRWPAELAQSAWMVMMTCCFCCVFFSLATWKMYQSETGHAPDVGLGAKADPSKSEKK
jgi:hypothetical protein